jgi:dihydroxy-acid dehydratase
LANSWLPGAGGPQAPDPKLIVEAVKQGVISGGGLPIEFRVLGACHGRCEEQQVFGQMLPTNDLIASSIELMVSASQYDGLILMGACDKYVAGLLKAAASLNLPTILLTGGPFRRSCCASGDDYVWPNYLSLAAEAIGLSMPGGAAIPCGSVAERLLLGSAAGRAIISLINSNLTARQFMTPASFENGARLVASLGGLTSLSTYLPSIAAAADVKLDPRLFDRLEDSGSLTEQLSFSASDEGFAFWQAGGVPAALRELKSSLRLKTLSVAGQTAGDLLDDPAAANGQPDRVLSPVA